MANELILVAYSDGRSPVPTGDGVTLMVDGGNPVVIEVSPDPSTWVPEDLALYRSETAVVGAPLVDGRRWVLTGQDRFGTFRASASAGVSIVESPETLVVPASSPVAAPPSAAAVPTAGSTAALVTDRPVAAGSVGEPEVPSNAPAGPVTPRVAPAPSDAPHDDADAIPAGEGLPASAGAQPQSPGADARSPARTDAPPTSPSAGVELPAGEYDGRFAAWVGAIFMLLSLMVLGIILVQVIEQLDVPVSPDPVTGATAAEAVAGRSGLVTSALLIGVSCILLLAGAALAALEVRARQRRDPTSAGAVRGAPGTRERMSVVLEHWTRLRAPVALLVAGAGVLGIAVLCQIYWGDHFG